MNEAHKALHGTKPFGETVKISKLTDEKVLWARKAWASSASVLNLSKYLDVSWATMQPALKGQTWKHLG